MTTAAIIDRTRGFRIWLSSQIYTGPDGVGANVPNVDDLVFDYQEGFSRVISVDIGKTNLTTLDPLNITKLNNGASTTDASFVTSPGTNSTAFRVYVDTTVTPHTLAVDSRATFNGGDNAYIRVFMGTDTTATGRIISSLIDASGNVLGNSLPLQNVYLPNASNVAVKCATIGSCSETVLNGDVCTVVTYSSAGVVTSKDRFIISLTNFIPSLDQSTKYITNIDLLSPFTSTTDKRLIECPINMVTQSLNFTARVSFSDGTTRIDPIDGTKWQIAGLTSYIASQIGQVVDVVLIYNLSTSEYAFNTTAPLPNRAITQPYRLKTVDVDTFYAVKLFALPTWNFSTSSYDLKWYLYNLERDTTIDVTSFIEYATTSGAWQGNVYGLVQNLTVAFNMQNLSNGYGYYRQVQSVNVTLVKPVTTINAKTYYTVGYTTDHIYGSGVQAIFAQDQVNAGTLTLDVSCQMTDVQSWLNKLYLNTDPLYLPNTEADPLTPTHALLLVGNDDNLWQREVLIGDLIKPISNINAVITQGTQIRLKLFKRTTASDLQVAILPMVATANS